MFNLLLVSVTTSAASSVTASLGVWGRAPSKLARAEKGSQGLFGGRSRRSDVVGKTFHRAGGVRIMHIKSLVVREGSIELWV